MTTVNPNRIILLAVFYLAHFTSTVFCQPSSNARHAGYKGQNFINFFPDTALATLVADELNKKITDNVTIKELAGIKGHFVVGPGDVSNLAGIGYLVGIDSFSCYKNEVSVLPAEIGKLKKLVLMDLTKAYNILQLPPQIGNLKELVHIRICLTGISTLPKEIGSLPKLRNLDLGANQLTGLPKEIGNLKNLRALDLSANPIKQLPDELCRLSSLTRLSAAHCQLKRLPENIGNLKKLRWLNLFENDLRYLPKSISRLNNLRYLNVYNNFNLGESYKSHLPVLLRKK
jgi:Leucine rich repeat